MRIRTNTGFTVIELMLCVLIIGFLLAIAVPGYMKSRENSQKNICIANIREIDEALDTWVADNGIQPGTVPSEEQQNCIYTEYIKGPRPKCPSGGQYTVHSVGSIEQVTCSLADKGHHL